MTIDKRKLTCHQKLRIADLAKIVGVSQSTVSRALNGEKGVSHDLRQKIVSLAQDSGYMRTNYFRGSNVMIVASADALLDYGRNQFTWYILDAMRSSATLADISLITRDLSHKNYKKLIAEASEDDSISGVILLTIDDNAILNAVTAIPRPVVLINCEHPFTRLTSISPCNRTASREACQYLINHGHSSQLFVMRKGRKTIKDRLDGWKYTMKQHNLPCGSDYIIEVEDWTAEHGRLAILQNEKKLKNGITAILAAGDPLAVGVMQGLTQMGISIPEQISVMGIDDLPQSAFMNPPLTTMHLPLHDIGRQALRLLHDLPDVPQNIQLAARVVERASVRKL